VVNGDNEPGIYVDIVINVLGLGRLIEHNEVLYEVKSKGDTPSWVYIRYLPFTLTSGI